MKLMMLVDVEAKDEFYPSQDSAGEPGRLPEPGQATALMSDVLADVTRREREIGWRVTRVQYVGQLDSPRGRREAMRAALDKPQD